MRKPVSPKNGINFGLTSGVLECDCSKANTFEVVANGNVTLDITNLYPGEPLSILFIQDGFGGHTVGFSGMTIETVNASDLTPSANAGEKTSWTFQGVSLPGGASAGTIRLTGVDKTGGGGGGVTSITAGANIAVTGTASVPIVGTVENPNFTTSVTTPLARTDELDITHGGSSQLTVTTDGAGQVSVLSAGATTKLKIGSNALTELDLQAFTQVLVTSPTIEFDIGATPTFIIQQDFWRFYIGSSPHLYWEAGTNGPQLRQAGSRIVDTPTVSITTTGAQAIDISKTNDVEINASLTGDTAITWSGLPDVGLDQNFTFRYAPNGHHATFPNMSLPVAPAVLNAAALATAEGTASFITMWCHVGSDQRITCTWTAQ